MDPVFPQSPLPPNILPRGPFAHHRSLTTSNGSSACPGLDLSVPISPLSPSRWQAASDSPSSLPFSSSPHSRPPPLPPAPPLSAGHEMGSHFTFGAHLSGEASGFSTTVSPQLPPRPNRTPSGGGGGSALSQRQGLR